MGTFARGAIWGVAALAFGIQFIRPARTNPPVVPGHSLETAVSVPPDVESVIARGCNDCHSNLTKWPWYSQVAPISWYVVNHVNGGRRQMNFSEWLRPGVTDPMQYTRQKFHSACREVQTGGMPLLSYLLIHGDAHLSQRDVQTICDWANKEISPGE